MVSGQYLGAVLERAKWFGDATVKDSDLQLELFDTFEKAQCSFVVNDCVFGSLLVAKHGLMIDVGAGGVHCTDTIGDPTGEQSSAAQTFRNWEIGVNWHCA